MSDICISLDLTRNKKIHKNLNMRSWYNHVYDRKVTIKLQNYNKTTLELSKGIRDQGWAYLEWEHPSHTLGARRYACSSLTLSDKLSGLPGQSRPRACSVCLWMFWKDGHWRWSRTGQLPRNWELQAQSWTPADFPNTHATDQPCSRSKKQQKQKVAGDKPESERIPPIGISFKGLLLTDLNVLPL